MTRLENLNVLRGQGGVKAADADINIRGTRVESSVLSAAYMYMYPTDRVWNASALLVQLAEQLEGLPRHARRLAPLI